MKILLVTPEYPPHSIGGGGIVSQSIAQTLSNRELDVMVVSGYFPTKSCFEKASVTRDGQIKVFWLPLMPTPKTNLHLKTVMPPNILSVSRLMRILFKQNFCVIHLHGFGHLFIDFAALICAVTKKPYILTLHGFPHTPQRAGGIVKLLYNVYLLTVGRLTLTKADKVTAISSSIKKEAVAYGADESRIVVIPNGLNLSKYQSIEHSTEFRRRFEINLNDRLVVAVGILHERKGFQYLIKAVSLIKKQYENIKLVLIGGDGGYRGELKELTKQLQVEDEVAFTGFLDSKMKLMAMSEAEIFAIPSLVEPFGLVALEAMACGRPIVAARVGGLAEVLEEGKTNLMMEPGNAEALADVIVRLINNKELRLRLSRNAREEVKKYDWKTIGQKYLKVYSNLKCE